MKSNLNPFMYIGFIRVLFHPEGHESEVEDKLFSVLFFTVSVLSKCMSSFLMHSGIFFSLKKEFLSLIQ
jgi:hypothetical protein